MNVLPNVSNRKAICYEYFPTCWQTIVWRNWGYVPAKFIAETLHTSEENIRNAAKELGLNPKEPVNAVWEKRGFLSLIRANWHLCTYDQILTLLNLTEENLAFILKEDDFMWAKLGELKPEVEPSYYMPLTNEQKKETERIVQIFKERFPAGSVECDNAFAFIDVFQKPLSEHGNSANKRQNLKKSEGLRMIYPYFALYGDTLIDESIDPFPERLLSEYAKVGVNGIWMQGVLYQLVEYPFESSMSYGWQKRIESLNRLVKKAKKFGIGVYLYLNEPRAMSESFFQRYPHLRGEQEGDFYAMCTSISEVQDYLYQGMKQLFTMVPELAGFFTITMSENLTNCYSRLGGEMQCPRCKNRTPWEIVAEVNNLMAKGAHDANPNAKAIAWAWGWWDEWAEKVIPLLTEGQILQCTSEEAMKFCIGGVNGSVLDYTMSLCGPGDKAKKMWRIAKEHGLQTSAKIQINNTWELSAVPYIPVFDKIAEHIHGLKEQGIQHLHVSWTLGGCPSPNLRLAAWLMDDKGTVEDFLIDWLGEAIGQKVNEAQKKISHAFSHYPFHLNTIYYGPQNFGPMAPFFLNKTGYQATMIGYPYDDVERWAGVYPVDVYENEYRQLCEEWKEGVDLLTPYEDYYDELNEMILMVKAALCHWKSAYYHIQFVNRRNCFYENGRWDCKELLGIIHAEMENVQTLIQLRLVDSRIGYESSNHYFYTLQDLKEKMINLVFCEEYFNQHT